MSKLNVSLAPHINSGVSTHNIMLDVVIAMIPASIAAVVLFGLQALWIILTCVASAVLSELLFNLITKRKQTIGDCSAIVTGLLLALNLSTNVPLWQCVIGSVFAIIVVKSLFGGLGHNIVNPAIAARVFMLLTFAAVAGGAQVSDFVLGDKAAELTASATPLAFLNEGVGAMEQAPSLFQLFLGTHGGAIGETCALALLIGFVYLVVRKVIKWYVPVSFIATVFVCYLVFTGDVTYSLAQVLAGGLLLGAIFMATDYVTTPTTGLGRVVFCVGCGLLTFAIRQFGSYPEGVSIAILTMNLLTPFISDWTKKKTLGGVK
jgi:electron transport complex protein RnfD